MLSASCALALVAVLNLFETAVAQQNFIPGAPSANFPACAFQCTLLLNAQGTCLPPAAPVTNQYFYDTCFCQSPILAPFYTTPDGVCDTSCTAESDRQTLQNWYKSFCASVTATTSGAAGANPGPVTTPILSTIVSGVSTVVVIIEPTAAATNTAASSGSNGSSGSKSNGSNGSWIDTHWRWILMIGIIIIGLGSLAFIAVYLKRRHRRKVDENRASMSNGRGRYSQDRVRSMTASPGVEIWGPHQHMAHTRGWEYNREQDAVMSGAAAGAISKKNSRRVKREPSEKARPRDRASEREVDENAPDIVAGRTKSQRKRDRDRARSRDFEQSFNGREKGSERSKHNSSANEKV